MKSRFDQIIVIIKAAHQLGLSKVALYARYQLGLRSGFYRSRTPAGGRAQPEDLKLANTGIRFPWREDVAAVLHLGGGEALLRQSDKICAGKIRLFDGEPVELHLTPSGELKHWTRYNSAQYDGRDIKWTWEVGRFGWAITLARAYFISREAKHVRAFWKYTEQFLEANPPNLGPHWVSAQEVAIRLISLTFCAQAFSKAKQSTKEIKAMLAIAIAQHAERIPVTMVYARAQDNNHLIIEALGLYTAGIVLPDHPEAHKWRAVGWKWFNRALQTQIAPDGAYMQHSANYHRLMLQAALWGAALAKGRGDELPAKTLTRLAAATHWLQSLVDHDTGRVPNLGPNDGAYILPFTVQPYEDYRPILQAASLAFLGKTVFPDGPWDEMMLWFGKLKASDVVTDRPELIHRIEGDDSWAYLRAAKFSSRPGHAYQLHLDLWWRGLNIAQDAGTFLYNADPPWDNALAATAVHNTISIAGRDQMTRAGKFLWLDWAQAKITATKLDTAGRLIKISAQHNGYRNIGLIHRRSVEYDGVNQWEIVDTLAGKQHIFEARLHWLLPDWPWELDGASIRIESPHGWVRLTISAVKNVDMGDIQLVRAGELLAGAGAVSPMMGWVSLNYGHKLPALSFAVYLDGETPLQITSTWHFPG
ncbi:MAG: alginate lyase family protein [Chloroflexi bacterium]|nr:alginate lyase family protein [Chloroflexota bacterium]